MMAIFFGSESNFLIFSISVMVIWQK